MDRTLNSSTLLNPTYEVRSSHQASCEPHHAESRPELPAGHRRTTVVAPYHQSFGWLTRILACVLLLLASPILLVALVLVRLSSPGPVFYRQTRLGLGNEPFTILKLRTMIADAERLTGPVWATKSDPRMTRIGRFLRALCWDEIPQLWNVVRGDMCLVGPRPERPEIAATLLDDIPEYRERHLVRPGITGLAQINLPADSDLGSVRRKLRLDLQYIGTATRWMDLRIVVCTLPRLVGVRTSRVARLLGVHCHESDMHRPVVSSASRKRRRLQKMRRRLRVRPR
jgi:lipopolysaccharide/colanic/teichoic acid biosynthesis glycosyltransferase